MNYKQPITAEILAEEVIKLSQRLRDSLSVLGEKINRSFLDCDSHNHSSHFHFNFLLLPNILFSSSSLSFLFATFLTYCPYHSLSLRFVLSYFQ